MKSKSSRALTALVIAQVLLLGACGGGNSDAATLPESLSVGNGTPEDIVANGSTAYVSNLMDGSVLMLDLADGGRSSVFVAAATDAFTSAWGLRVVPAKNWLLSIQNMPYDFNPAHAQTGRVTAFDLTTGAKIRSWSFPAQAVGNSVDVDAAGSIYVGDVGPNTRILKIDPATNVVSTWATDARWLTNGFGIGGMVFSGTGIYAAHNNILWYVGMNPDGTAAAPMPVKIEGDPVIFADGMTWVDGGINYAENDLFVQGAKGSVFRIQFSSNTTATRSLVRGGLFDPSGVTTTTVDGKAYMLVNESRLGYAIGTEKGTPAMPYQVKVFQR